MNAGHVDRRLRVGFPEGDAPLGCVLRDLERVRVLEQRLGRNASPVEARAAQDGLALDDGDAEAKLRRANGGHVTAGSGSNDDDVESISHLPPADQSLLREGRHGARRHKRLRESFRGTA